MIFLFDVQLRNKYDDDDDDDGVYVAYMLGCTERYCHVPTRKLKHGIV